MAKKKNTAYAKRYFQFNLVTPKTEAEITKLVDRDNTLFYSFLLIFFGMLLFFALSVIKSVLVDPILEEVNSNIAEVNTEISNYDEIRATNGELYIKAQALEPILEKDVDVIKVLDLEARLRAEFPNLVEVVDYGRRPDGAFAMSFLINDTSDVTEIINYLTTQPDVDDVFLENILWENGQDNPGLVDISFFLLNITPSG